MEPFHLMTIQGHRAVPFNDHIKGMDGTRVASIEIYNIQRKLLIVQRKLLIVQGKLLIIQVDLFCLQLFPSTTPQCMVIKWNSPIYGFFYKTPELCQCVHISHKITNSKGTMSTTHDHTFCCCINCEPLFDERCQLEPT